jgi:hypothetical protein
MLDAKRTLRRAQRLLHARQREKKLGDIMTAAEEEDTQRLFRLIATERSCTSATPEGMVFDNVTISKENLVQAWAEYFESLATPADKSHYLQEYKDYVDLKFDLLCCNDSRHRDTLYGVDGSQLTKIIGSLKNNKAPDKFGITAEHLKYAHPEVNNLIVTLLNRIIEEESIPPQLRHGVITPVYKQKKSPKVPDNYRRITVVPMISKLLEKVMVQPTKEILATRLSKLQRGFCDAASSANTAFILTESISEALDARSPLFVAFLDATKAFDVVWHKSMLCKLHDLGVNGKLWSMYVDMYKALSSQVKCNGELSLPFEEKQGVRQGGIPSTELFKARMDNLLKNLTKYQLGFQIGSINTAAPTCADDVALVASSPSSLQALINIAEHDASCERYEFSVAKTKIMVMNACVPQTVWDDLNLWHLNERNLSASEQETHLGVERIPNGRAVKAVEHNIQRARRAAYALMGAGMHGVNGLHIRLNLKLWNCYVLPRLLYGLEVLPMTQSGLDQVDAYQRQTMRRLLHVPQGTSTSGLYLVLGQLPIRELLARNKLTLFINMIRNSGSVEEQIIRRQLAVKDSNSNSWVVSIKVLLARYNLPSAYDLLLSPPTKAEWKSTLRKQLLSYAETILMEDASTKISLKYLNLEHFQFGKLHPALASVQNSTCDILRGHVKVRFLLGQYRLQADVARQSGGSPICKLCMIGSEDLYHVVFLCPKLRDHTMAQRTIHTVTDRLL